MSQIRVNDEFHETPVLRTFDGELVTVDNPLPVTQAGGAAVSENSNYEMNIARGLIPGQTSVFRNGVNLDLTTGGVEESIWVEGGIYPHTSWTSAGKLYVSSSSSSDTGQSILVQGLDASYNLQSETITTNGTSTVQTVNNYIRIHTATITSGAVNVGSIRFHITNISGTVVAHIGAGIGMTKLSQYTVPAGKTAYVMYGDATSFKGGSGNIGTQVRMYVRPFGQVFTQVFVSEVVNGIYRNDYRIPFVLPEKTDIDIRGVADGNNTTMTTNYQMILIDNE